MKKLITLAAVGIVLVAAITGGAISERIWGFKILDRYWPKVAGTLQVQNKVLTEENVVIDVAEKVSPSVVTVGIKKTQILNRTFDFDPFSDPFGFFREIPRGQPQENKIEQDIGSGFIIAKDGLVVTNKHVVGDTEAKYKVVTSDDKTYEVEKIYRDAGNDLGRL